MTDPVSRRRKRLHWRGRMLPWPAAVVFWLGISVVGWLLVWGLVGGVGTDHPPIAADDPGVEALDQIAPAAGRAVDH